MKSVIHSFEGLGKFEVEYVCGISYDDLKSILEHLEEIDYIDYTGLDSEFEIIGSGSSARVYGYKDYAIKVLHNGREFGGGHDNDVQVLKDLYHIEYTPDVYAVINNKIMIMQRVEGITLEKHFATNSSTGRGDAIVNEEFVEKWDDAILSIIASGYTPKDLHGNNVMIDEKTKKPMIIDTGWFYKHYNNYDKNNKDVIRSEREYDDANRWIGESIKRYVFG